MTGRSLFLENSKVLHPTAFAFGLESELKRAVRTQNFLTLVVIEITRQGEGTVLPARDGTIQAVAEVVARDIRNTDLLGHTEEGDLALVLLNANFERAKRVIQRLVSRVENYEFPIAFGLAVGAACCPTHAADAETLKREAMPRPRVVPD